MLLVAKGNCGTISYCNDQRTCTIIEPLINMITSDLAAVLRLNSDMIDTKLIPVVHVCLPDKWLAGCGNDLCGLNQ